MTTKTDPLQRHDATEVDPHQCGGERTVDESTVDDYIYVVEVVLEDGEGRKDREGQESKDSDPIADRIDQDRIDQVRSKHVSAHVRYDRTDYRYDGRVDDPLELLA